MKRNIKIASLLSHFPGKAYARYMRLTEPKIGPHWFYCPKCLRIEKQTIKDSTTKLCVPYCCEHKPMGLLNRRKARKLLTGQL